MADPRFFNRAGPFDMAELAQQFDCVIAQDVQPSSISLVDVAALDTAKPGELSFFDNIKYKEQLKVTKASACVVSPEYQELLPDNVVAFVTKNPYKTYAFIAAHFYPNRKAETSISNDASVDSSAKVGDLTTISAGANIGEGAEIGESCYIGPNAVVGDYVVLGDHCSVGANASISHSIIGQHVSIYPGCRIGQDGFGFAIDPAGHVKVPQLGRVLIGNGVEIGANTCIDRGAGPDTVIGDGTWIDNLVQIGHNVRMGRGCVIVAQVGVSGSTVLEDFVVLGGQVGVAGHLNIGTGARVGAQSGVMRDIPAGSELLGSPAIPIRDKMKQVAAVSRLVKTKSKSK